MIVWVIGILGGFALLWLFGGHIMSMSQSAGNVAVYARNAGFTDGDLLKAVAIALAESGGQANNYNPETDFFTRNNISSQDAQNMGSYGLWQIFLYEHPEFADKNLYDPQVNANAAYSVYRAAGNSFRPWSTFTENEYQAFLGDARTQIAA